MSLLLIRQVISKFVDIRDKFEMHGAFPSLFIVTGPPGSGKTSLVHALLTEMCDAIGANKNKAKDFLLEVTHTQSSQIH